MNGNYQNLKTPVAKFMDGVMMIEKVDLNAEANAFIEKEQEKHEIENEVICNYAPFCFVSKINGTVIGAITGATFYSEIYIDELVVKKIYRRKGIGTQLINEVETFYRDQGFDNINCCTNEFQASGFYEKCGFKLEFVRENKFNPKLNKYFYIKYLDGTNQLFNLQIRNYGNH